MYSFIRYKIAARLAVPAVFAFMASSLSAATGGVILADSFDRPDGARLDGAVVQTWESRVHTAAPKWTAGKNAIIQDGRVSTDADGAVELRLATPNQTRGVLTLMADVSHGDSGAEWIGLSFLSSTTVNIFNPANTLLLIVNRGGIVMLFKNGSAEKLSTTQIAGFDPARTYSLELRYDREAGVAHVLVDGVRMNARPVAVAKLNSDTFSAVGLRVHGASVKAGALAIDNVSYVIR